MEGDKEIGARENAPAIHQRRVNRALHRYLGKFCHIYLDDIIIWSDNVDEHRRHIRLILSALKEAGLYCNLKKTKLFQSEVNFLGHIINRDGIHPDNNKINKNNKVINNSFCYEISYLTF